MKSFIRLISIIVLSIIMALSSCAVFSAVEITTNENTAANYVDDDDLSREYELIWKYKEQDGHLWKRRWNMTLGCWYDPAWILVY